MAAPNRILSLSLGNQTVALAEFKTGQNGGLVLASHETRELLADPAADATRLAQTKLVLDEMVQKTGLKKAKINYAVSAQSVFTRFVKLPSVGEEQVDQIVTFEAQQNVPYPIDEVVWDYQLVDSGDPAQVEVVIVAIKSDLLDDINAAVDEAHLQTSIVDVAPMALYNAYRYNYSDVAGCSLIIDIGARTTNLIFIESHKVFSRSIPNGGSTITQAIARDFNEPFGASEERKKRDGFVSLGGAYAEPEDPDVARVSKMIRNSMTRLHAEIARSISFYRSQQGGAQPQRVYLSGGSVTLPYMREFFHEKFQLPVEFFNPLRNVAVGTGLNLDEVGKNAHRMGELVGLALRGTSNCPMELNLRPVSVVRRHQLAERRPYILLAGVCTLLALAGWWLYFNHAAAVTNQVSEGITPTVNTLKDFETRMNKARADIKAQQDTAAPLLTAVEDRSYWLKVIDDINKRLPIDLIWVTNFEAHNPAAGKDDTEPRPAPGGKGKGGAKGGTILTLKGLYLFNDRPNPASVVDDFANKLAESELYTVDKEPPNFKRNLPNDSEWAFEYEIPLILKNPINLPRQMNWIKENKFLAGFFGAMLVGVGALGYLVFAAMGSYDEASTRYTGLSSELTRLQNLPVSPNDKNLKALVAQKKDAAEVVAAFQTSLAAKSFPLEPMTPEQFQDKLKTTKNASVERAALGGTHLPDKFFLGFDDYEARPPVPESAAPLGRELKAIDWVLNQVFDSHVTELKSMKREHLPEESGKKADKADKKGKPLVATHSFEITMLCRQPAFAAVLNAVAGPKAPQFYIPRVVRIKNENDKGPPRAAAIAPAAAVPTPTVNPQPAGAPAAPAATAPAGQAIAQYIVGDEQLEITMAIDIVDFAEPATAAPSK